MDKDLIARASTTIRAPSERVWDALVNPAAIKQYMFGTDVVSDWREGSPIVWKGEWQGKPYEDKGVILQLKPERILQYSHFSPLSGVPDKLENYHTVTIELSADRNQTHVSLAQDNNATEEERTHSEKNWEMMLAALKKFLEQPDAQAQEPMLKPNPALDPLKELVGEWNMELSNAAFLPSPSDTVNGNVSFEWVEEGAFLVMRMGDKPPSPPQAVWLIGRDESMPDYQVLYFDSRKVSRIYEMSFADGVWKMWRDAPGFSQRFQGTFSDDGNTITACWEKSFDGSKWEHDFDLTYTKVR
jgi:uncharacterized protein YndB with AHSA1/START domain